MRYKFPALAALAVLLAAASAGVLAPHALAARLLDAAAALRALGAFGLLLFTLLVALLALVGLVPGALLGIAAGAVYGLGLGLLSSAAGLLAGAVIAFALGRSMLRPVIAAALGRRARLAALDDMVTRDRWRLVLLLRVSPVMPFSLTSYALGLSGILFRDYLLGTLAALPPLLGYVTIGALGGATLAAPHLALMQDILLGVGAAATLALTLHLGRLLSRALRLA